MKRKNVLGWFFGGLLVFASCKKIDDTYRNYTNNLSNFNGTTLQYLQAGSNAGQYDSLLLAIGRLTGISDSLAKDSVTFFAMNNNSFKLAFEDINSARADSVPAMPPISINTINPIVLDSFMCRYIVRGKYVSKDYSISSDGLDVSSLKYGYTMHAQALYSNASGFVGGGPKKIVFSDTKHSIFIRYWVSVNTITSDITTNNGIVNVLTPSHEFGFGSDFVRAANYR